MIDAALARITGIPERVVRAIRTIESGSDPHALRFEPHHFRRLRPDLAARVPFTPSLSEADRKAGRPASGPSHVRRETDRGAFEHAFALDPEAAVRSTSWGSYQVLGAHLLALTPGSAYEDVAAFWGRQDGFSGELFASWVKANPRILHAARATPPDFEGIAKAYNGAGAAPRYAIRLRAAYGAS